MRELHPLHAIRLSTKKRAERLAQSGVDHPGEAGRRWQLRLIKRLQSSGSRGA